MPKVVWSSENDRKLLIRLIDRSAKSYDSEALSKLFPGATPKAIEERIAKLKREAKTIDGPGKSMKIPLASSVSKERGRTKRKSMRDSTDDDEEGGPEVKKSKEERL